MRDPYKMSDEERGTLLKATAASSRVIPCPSCVEKDKRNAVLETAALDAEAYAYGRIAELEVENERLREQRNSLRKNIEQTALATGYAQGLEAAAKVCDAHQRAQEHNPGKLRGGMAWQCAATIRALTEKSE